MLYVPQFHLFHLFNLLLSHTKEHLHISRIKQFAQLQCYWKYLKVGYVFDVRTKIQNVYQNKEYKVHRKEYSFILLFIVIIY